MKKTLIFSVLFLCIACTKEMEEDSEAQSDVDSLTKTSDSTSFNKMSRKPPVDSMPIWGYRFSITGDFDGDHKQEKLTEHYYSSLTNQESPKFYTGFDFDALIYFAVQKKPYSFALSSNKKIDTLRIASSPQLFGISYMKNEGDLNADGTDEISYVVDWADYSSRNTWHIVTYKNKQWKELYAFSIHDGQLPDLTNASIFKGDSSIQKMEQELFNFKGLVKKIKTNKIQVLHSEAGEIDTLLVDLR